VTAWERPAEETVRCDLRHSKDVTRDLFADPQLDYHQAVQFYRHEMDWSNRLILGDSLQVMASLAQREDLAGIVQMIYIDPPYGIQFKSNFAISASLMSIAAGRAFRRPHGDRALDRRHGESDSDQGNKIAAPHHSTSRLARARAPHRGQGPGNAGRLSAPGRSHP
jgi:hypothetical protein